LVKLSNVGRQVEMDVLRNGQYVRVNALIGRLEDFVDAVQQAAEPKR
jgi:hypothetical protein